MSVIQIMIDKKKQLKNVECFKYLDCKTTNDIRGTWEIKCRIP